MTEPADPTELAGVAEMGTESVEAWSHDEADEDYPLTGRLATSLRPPFHPLIDRPHRPPFSPSHQHVRFGHAAGDLAVRLKCVEC